ncbi:MAG TPA: DUF6518 family protein [Mycobacteriales bacterium]|nr:DUF6518 family protein [Mycobacteriales bacterium]
MPAASSSWVRAGSRGALAIVSGAAVGAVLEWSVPHLPFSLEPLANSAAPWLVLALAIALTTRRWAEAVVLAVTTLVALVAGFYVAEHLRGWPVSRHQVALWTAASFAAGPLVGLSAAWLRGHGRTAAALGAGIVGGLLAGEAMHGIRQLQFSTPHRYWHAQLVVGIAAAVALPLWRSRHRLVASAPPLMTSLATCAVVGAGTYVAYQFP